VSVWADKVQRDIPQAGIRNIGVVQYMELPAFIKKVCTAPDNCDGHIRPQALNIPDGIFVGRVENIELDWEHVMLNTGLPKLQHCKKSKHDPPFTYLTPELRALVSERFKDDFRRWNYRWPE
jgi:hypothetical protein